MRGAIEGYGGAYLRTLGLYRLKLGMCRLELLELLLFAQLLKLFLVPIIVSGN